jgi:peptidoglycan/LPS O-acetylase OafA/YrhL
MIISITNVFVSTCTTIAVFALVLFFSIKKRNITDTGLSMSVTQELKGFAIFAVIFSHIGYFLVSDKTFLYPLTIFAGVGVNIFLFLSGYGLTISRIKKYESIFDFYKKRIFKVLIPFWIVLFLFLFFDYVFLSITYPLEYVYKAFFGIFTTAHIYNDLNSPFWFLTLLLFYYFIFPFVFSKKYPWGSAIVLYMITFFIIKSDPSWMKNVIGLHKVHLVAFPLGIIIAWLSGKLKKYFNKKYNTPSYIRNSILCVLFCGIAYLGLHSGVGESTRIEEYTSLVTVGVIVLFFVLKRFEIKVLSLFGIYSYEMYLLHWPILYRYDFLYASIPAWGATILYMLLFFILGFIVQRSIQKLFCSRKNTMIH